MNGAGQEGFDPSDQDQFPTTGRGAGKRGGDGADRGLPEGNPGSHRPRNNDDGAGAAGQVPLELTFLGGDTAHDLVAGIQAAARIEAAARGQLLRLTANLYAAALARRGETVQARLGQASPWVAAAIAQAAPDVVLRDVAAEIGVALMLPTGTARATVAEALIFATDLPLVLTALEQGRVSWSQARVILTHWRALMEPAPTARALKHLSEADRDAVLKAAADLARKATSLVEDLLARAPQVTTAQLGDYARRRRAALGAAGHQRACAAARKRRDVWVSPEDDGLAYLTALLDAPTAVAIAARVHRMATTLTDTPADTRHPNQGEAGPGLFGGTPADGPQGSGLAGNPGGSPGDGSGGNPLAAGNPLAEHRSMGEKRADVLADLLLDAELPESSGVPRGIRGQVSIMVPVTDLIRHDPQLAGPLAQAHRGAGTLEGGTRRASGAHRADRDSRDDRGSRVDRDARGEEATGRPGAKTPPAPPPAAASSPPPPTTEGSSPSPRAAQAVQRPPGARLTPPVCPHTPDPGTLDPAPDPSAEAGPGTRAGAGTGEDTVSTESIADSTPTAVLAGYGPIAGIDALRVAAAASSWRRVLTDPHTGVITDYSRETYTVPAGLRALLTIRDETCRFPGCRHQATSSDLDHTIAWDNGGTTTATNLGFLCRHHHRIKHEACALGTWQVHHIDPDTGLPVNPVQANSPGLQTRAGVGVEGTATGAQQTPAGVLEWTSSTGIVRRTVPGAATPVTTTWLTGNPPTPAPAPQASEGTPPLVQDDPAPF